MRFGEDITYCIKRCEGCYRSEERAGIGIHSVADLSEDELCPRRGWERIWRAEMKIPIKLEKRTDGERKAYAEGYSAGKRDAVRHGRWVSLTPPEMRTYETDVYFMCSECKNAVRFIANDLPYEHCPHCLARCEK